MSKGVLINSLDTYIGTALYEELLGENPAESEFELYGTYFNKEISEKPLYVKKMMKMKEKPGLFRKYLLEKMDYYVYDLHSGKLSDLEFAIKALTKTPLESEKTLIVISSVLSWGQTPPNMVEDKPEPLLDEDGNPIIKSGEENEVGNEAGQGNEGKAENEKFDPNSNEENAENSAEMDVDFEYENETENPLDPDKDIEKIPSEENNNNNPELESELQNQNDKIKKRKRRNKKEKQKEIKYKQVGYQEEEFEKRIPSQNYTLIKEFEDHLLKLKFDNLNIFIICAGIPYGNCETVFNYFFKSAWLQNQTTLPYFGENSLPTIHIKDLAKIVKRLITGTKPETKYIFATDRTQDKSLKNIIQSLSRGIGTGMTRKIAPEDEFLKNLKFDSQDYFIDTSLNIYSKNKVDLILTENEYTWQNFLHYDIMLAHSKFVDEEFEWHCKEGIPSNIEKLMKEFAKYRKLRPLKIVLNCTNKDVRQFYAEKISKFFNIPVINYEKIVEMLSLRIEELPEEQVFMTQKYLILKEKMDFVSNNPDFVNEENLLLCDPNEIMIEALKYLLNENACRNRGYVLEGMPVNVEEIGRLYYKKEEIVPEEGAPVEEEENEAEVEVEGEAEGDGDNKEENLAKNSSQDLLVEAEGEDVEEKNEDNNEDENNNSNDEKSKSKSFNANQDQDAEAKKELQKIALPPKKKKKVKPKKYKTIFDKDLLPESIITICLNDNENGHNVANFEIDNIFWEVENFYQENNIEILNLLYDSKSQEHTEEKPDEIFEDMRIYIERNGRPFNYFSDTDSDINSKRENFVKEKVRKYDLEDENRKKREQEIEKQKEDEFWRKMEKRIEAIKKDKEEIDNNDADKFPTRKFLLLNIMPILTKGMLEVCKINPIDPIDYLADFLFKNSTD